MKDILTGVVLLIVSATYYIGGSELPSSVLDTTVTSAAFPKLLAIAGILLSLGLIAQGFVVSRAQEAGARQRRPFGLTLRQAWDAHKRAVGLLAIMIVFLLLFEKLGYPVSLGVLIFATITYQGIPVSWKSVAVSVLGAVAMWLFFVKLLGISMPQGIWSHFPI